MKRSLIFFILFVVLLSDSSNAQVIQDNNFFKSSWGVKVGINYQMLAGKPWVPKLNSGFLGGFYADYMRGTSGFRVEASVNEAHYTTIRNASYTPVPGAIIPSTWDTVSKGDFNVLYFRLPILAEFKLYKSLVFLIGPEYCQQISITDINGAYTQDYSNRGGINNILKTVSFLGDIGLESKIKQKMIIGLRFSLGMTNVNKGPSQKYNNFTSLDAWKTWGLQLGFCFKLKSNFQ